MEFWGAEVKVGETVKVDPFEIEAIVHLSQVALGEAKKEKPNESVIVYVTVGEQKLVLGTLSRDKIPQISLDVVFDSEFELSHSSKTASVHFCGYKSLYEDDYSEGEEEESDSEDEDIPLTTALGNGKPEPKAEDLKLSETKKVDAKNAAPAKKAAPAKQVKVVDPKEDKDEDSDDESDESDDEIGSSDDEMENADSDDEDDESDEDDEEETPVKKVNQGKKRPNESASKTPVSSKKSKNATPEKTDGKKAGHTATPHPKKAGKTPISDAKDAKSPKSAGGLTCNSCSKTFNSETGLQQHSKAKHAAK